MLWSDKWTGSPPDNRRKLAGAQGRAPVVIDGGIRRGTDIFKALALGATAVGVGRPYIWGLGAFGQEGVETVLMLLRRVRGLAVRRLMRSLLILALSPTR